MNDLQSPTKAGTNPLAEGAAGPADGNTVAPRLEAMLPAQLLQPGEIILLLLKPSPLFIILSPLNTLVLLIMLTIVATYAAGRYTLGISQRDMLLFGVALIGMRLFWELLEWLSRVYVLTDQRMIRIQGVLRIQVFEARLNQIQHTNLLFRIRERLFGLGTVGFATAGTAVTEVFWQMIANPLDVHQKIVQTLRRYRR